jgi:hypothetical protein
LTTGMAGTVKNIIASIAKGKAGTEELNEE